jgi:hypothetical protein
MNLSFFSLKVDFLTPMIFRSSASAELGPFALAKGPQTPAAVPVLSLALHGDSLAAQAPLAKIDIRSK